MIRPFMVVFILVIGQIAMPLFAQTVEICNNAIDDEQGTYQETIMSDAGCDSTVYLTLEYYSVFAPNVFTPNEDGINDYFTISGGEDLVKIKDFRIFDKWGGQVFEDPEVLINQQGVGWNGRIGNEEARTGVYLFNASLLMDEGQERVCSGSVTLLR